MRIWQCQRLDQARRATSGLVLNAGLLDLDMERERERRLSESDPLLLSSGAVGFGVLYRYSPGFHRTISTPPFVESIYDNLHAFYTLCI